MQTAAQAALVGEDHFMSSVETAALVVAELEAKLAAASERAITLAIERRRVAFSAHSGDAAAKKELAKLTSESATIGLDVENLHAALDEGRARVRAAELDEERGRLRQAAREAAVIAEKTAERGTLVSKHAWSLCSELRSTFDDARRLAALGAPTINERSLKLALTRTLLAMLRDTGLDVEMIAPGERHQADELIGAFAGRVTEWAAPFLAKAAA
jgi:hypothetical protein